MTDIKSSNWDEIKDTNPDCFSSKKYLYLEGFKVGTKQIHYCKEINSNLRGIMFITKKSLAKEKELPITKGFEVRFDILHSFEEDDVAIVIKLSGNEYTDAFIYLIKDIFSGFDRIESEKAIVDHFFNQITIWKTFFDKARSKGLSDTYRRGLFAELQFLKDLVYPVHKNKSLKYWTGPEAAIHDFEFGKTAVEVKSSAGNKSTKIRISNERQLDDAGYENLYLFQVSISPRKNANPTLVDMVKEVGELFSNDHACIVEYNNLLLQYGYHPMHEEYYLSEGYHIDEENLFVVKEGFPRIIGNKLPDGIGALKYSVDLSSCTDFKVENDQILDKIQNTVPV